MPRSPKRCAGLAVLGVAGAGALDAPTLAQSTFRILTNMPNGTGGGVMFGVSADGTTAVGSAGTFHPGTWRPFRWRLDTGVVEDLGLLPGNQPGQSAAVAVSADGSAISGWRLDDAIVRSFRWTAQTGMVEIPDFPGGDQRITATGISGDGSTVVGFGNSATEHAAFRWTPDGGLVSLGTIPGTPVNSTEAYGISQNGQVIVGEAFTLSGYRAFRWTQATGMVDLGSAGREFSEANAASADGSVIVGTTGYTRFDGAPVREAFRWTQETGLVLLGSLTHPNFDFPFSQATGVTADGSMIIGEGYGGWVWTAATGMVPIRQYLAGHGIDVGPYSISELRGISADGRVIVGTANDVMGFPVAWAATIPAPSVGAACAALVGAAGIRRRRPGPPRVICKDTAHARAGREACAGCGRALVYVCQPPRDLAAIGA